MAGGGANSILETGETVALHRLLPMPSKAAILQTPGDPTLQLMLAGPRMPGRPKLDRDQRKRRVLSPGSKGFGQPAKTPQRMGYKPQSKRGVKRGLADAFRERVEGEVRAVRAALPEHCYAHTLRFAAGGKGPVFVDGANQRVAPGAGAAGSTALATFTPAEKRRCCACYTRVATTAALWAAAHPELSAATITEVCCGCGCYIHSVCPRSTRAHDGKSYCEHCLALLLPFAIATIAGPSSAPVIGRAIARLDEGAAGAEPAAEPAAQRRRQCQKCKGFGHYAKMADRKPAEHE